MSIVLALGCLAHRAQLDYTGSRRTTRLPHSVMSPEASQWISRVIPSDSKAHWKTAKAASCYNTNKFAVSAMQPCSLNKPVFLVSKAMSADLEGQSWTPN